MSDDDNNACSSLFLQQDSLLAWASSGELPLEKKKKKAHLLDILEGFTE